MFKEVGRLLEGIISFQIKMNESLDRLGPQIEDLARKSERMEASIDRLSNLVAHLHAPIGRDCGSMPAHSDTANADEGGQSVEQRRHARHSAGSLTNAQHARIPVVIEKVGESGQSVEYEKAMRRSAGNTGSLDHAILPEGIETESMPKETSAPVTEAALEE